MLRFINPLFAWLALAAAIPLIIHLLNRRRYQKVPWAAMDFLLKALRKNRRRLQMESLILLLLRMLIVTILAFVLARPYLKGSTLFKEPDTHLVIALDNSYSMGYRAGMTPLFEEAKKVAAGLMEMLKPEKGDKLSLLTISDRPEVLINESSFQMDQARNKLANLGLSDYATDVTRSLILAQEMLAKSASARKILYLVTDNQRIMWDKINTLKDKNILGSVPIKIIQIGPLSSSNNLISRVYADKSIITVRKPVTFYAEVRNYSSNDVLPGQVKVSFSIQGQKYSSSAVELARNNSVLVPFVHVFNEPGQYWIKAELENDSLALDDSRLFSVAVKEGINTLIVNGQPAPESSEDEIIFLRYALSPSRQPSSGDSFSPYRIDTATANQFINTDEIKLGQYDLVILANVEFLPQERAGQLEAFVRNGGGLMLFLGDKVNKTSYNELLYKNGAGLLPYSLSQVKGDPMRNDIIRFGEIDFAHPALAFFSAVKERFNTLSVFRYYGFAETPVPAPGPESKETITATVLARLNLPDKPAIITEKPFGSGRTIVVGTSADTEWNLMPARPMYVMLMDQLAMYLASFKDAALNRNLLVGQAIEMSVESKSVGYTPPTNILVGGYTLRLPKKESISLSPASAISQTAYILRYDTQDSGLYTLSGNGQERFFAVNPNPAEGDLRKMSPEELKNLIPAQAGDNNPNAPSVSSGIEIISAGDALSDIIAAGFLADKTPDNSSTSPLWKHLIYILLVSVALEMLLAWRFGRR